MREKNLFTAVGRLTRTRDQRGIECPMIILGGKEYLLDLQELLLWTFFPFADNHFLSHVYLIHLFAEVSVNTQANTTLFRPE